MATATLPHAARATPETTATVTPRQPAATPIPWEIPAVPFPFSEPGPYQVGMNPQMFTDPGRDGRTVSILIWYPALDYNPDTSGAPYPLILSSTIVAEIFARNLVSHGFVVVSVNNLDSYDPWDQNLVDQPLDILFALDQVASHPPEELAGMIDAEHTGVMGYAFDGYNALALSGARIDPAFFLERCAIVFTLPPELSVFGKYYCPLVDEWDPFVTHAGEALTTSQDDLWQPMTDRRIQAVLPMAGAGSWLFGDQGLAAADRPAMILVGTRDELYPENIAIFRKLGAPEKVLISFIGQGHDMITDETQQARMQHFAVAFFGYHLQSRQDYAAYYSEEFVSHSAGLAWGVYMGDKP